MRPGEPFRQRDADRAHGKVDCARAQASDHALIPEHDAFNGTIVRQHRHDGLALAGVCHQPSGVCALLGERSLFTGRAVVHGDLMAGPEQVPRHAGSHVPKPDESDFHDLTSSGVRTQRRVRRTRVERRDRLLEHVGRGGRWRVERPTLWRRPHEPVTVAARIPARTRKPA